MKFLPPYICLLIALLTPPVLLFAQTPLVVTYVGGYRGNVINSQAIEAQKLTHILYAFANCRNNQAHLDYPKTDDINLKHLIQLKKINSRLKVLISVGGMGWSHNFSNMALTEAGRKTFAASCANLIKKYELDGVDIDWEFPGYAGEGGNIYRDADKQNYTLMFKALREAFDLLEKQAGKRLLITTAIDGWGSHFLPHTEMDKVQQYVDYILLMAYNFNTKTKAGGHFLYSPKEWLADGSWDGAVKAFTQAGVPVQKLVLGAGFFPAAFQMNSSDPKNRDYVSRTNFRGGLARVYQMVGNNGYLRYWDQEGQAPYLFNTATKTRIAYEDEQSVKAKAAYIRQSKVAGLMYWDYFSDPHRKLLNALTEVFNSKL